MRKAFKIILAVFVIFVVLVLAVGAVFFLDLAAYTATGASNLTPTVTSVGKAIVIYDPGLSGAAKSVADKVASDLQEKGYSVTLAGIKSSAASNTTGYGVVVVGGPIYAGSPTISVKDCLNDLKPAQGVRVGVFGSGAGATSPSDVQMIRDSVTSLKNGPLSDAVVVKIGQGEDLAARASDFVSQLTA
ncbi:MAG TPA: flavodoxin domain-containing protein [Candidatus Nanoarchaeia archaeon]|nr:flavodoxin domain-containing protein [Candidatus Nanoarchaeia archaeon]